MEKQSMFKQLNGNLKSFKKDFIIAGPRTNVIGWYRKLLDLGAEKYLETRRREEELLSNNHEKIVLFCYNEGTSKKFAKVIVISRSWWNDWHNPRIVRRPMYKTYNCFKQAKTIINQLNIEEIQEVIPDED